jgi:hypothetical protein
LSSLSSLRSTSAMGTCQSSQSGGLAMASASARSGSESWEREQGAGAGSWRHEGERRGNIVKLSPTIKREQLQLERVEAVQRDRRLRVRIEVLEELFEHRGERGVVRIRGGQVRRVELVPTLATASQAYFALTLVLAITRTRSRSRTCSCSPLRTSGSSPTCGPPAQTPRGCLPRERRSTSSTCTRSGHTSLLHPSTRRETP